ncbi:MAG: sigma-70 family RNA polymerase sigma factor [Chloroflexota bacterium]
MKEQPIACAPNESTRADMRVAAVPESEAKTESQVSSRNPALGERLDEAARPSVIKHENHRDPVLQVLDRRGWELVTNPEPFIESVYADAQARRDHLLGQTATRLIERATIHQYCLVLCAACAETGSPRQRRAFEELTRHLYRIALFKTHDIHIAEDCAQQALFKIWRHLDQCREPGSFLNWCNLIVLNTIREHFRAEMKKAQADERKTWFPLTINPSDASPDDVAPSQDWEDSADADASSKFENVLRLDLRRQLVDAIRASLKNEIHAQVIVELFLNDKSFNQVAEQLRTTPGNIQVIKSRALVRLRGCAEMVRLYTEWLA